MPVRPMRVARARDAAREAPSSIDTIRSSNHHMDESRRPSPVPRRPAAPVAPEAGSDHGRTTTPAGRQLHRTREYRTPVLLQLAVANTARAADREARASRIIIGPALLAPCGPSLTTAVA